MDKLNLFQISPLSRSTDSGTASESCDFYISAGLVFLGVNFHISGVKTRYPKCYLIN